MYIFKEKIRSDLATLQTSAISFRYPFVKDTVSICCFCQADSSSFYQNGFPELVVFASPQIRSWFSLLVIYIIIILREMRVF